MNDAATFETGDSNDIAIIGMAGRFPRANDVETFWRNLRDGVEAISFFSEQELELENVPAEILGSPHFVKARAILDDIDLFDASFFSIPAREAIWMDPQHRLFLETAWSALESAGYRSESYKGLAAVYAGTSTNTYALTAILSPGLIEEVPDPFQLGIVNDKDYLATRVSYKLNLRGESLTVQTACSTSLVAVHLACQSLLGGQCDMAIAGGVSVRVPQKTGYLFEEGKILSNDGHCRAFDHRASGTVSGNGVGAVVLKMLDEAVRDGDYIYAVIKGSAMNNDGSLKVGYTAPSVDGQADVISKALAMSGVDADSITYVEAHGTGTPVGDPIEFEALTRAFRFHTGRSGFCALGSVKTNIGHLDAASGIAGLIKAALALKHKQIPPVLHFERPNPEIDLENSPFYINPELIEWKRTDAPRRAGVSSFGIGGTNVHIVLEEAPEMGDARGDAADSRPYQLVTLSARTAPALDNMTGQLADYMESNPGLNLSDLAYTRNACRMQFAHRRFVAGRDNAEVVKALRSARQPESKKRAPSFRSPSVAFLFPGQGSQSVNMARGLYDLEPEFRHHIDACAESLADHLHVDLREALYPSESHVQRAGSLMSRPEFTLASLFAVEYSLARLWMSWGARPHAMFGHSYGEYVAACLAGVFSLEDALKLAVERGRLIGRLLPGAMTAVRLAESELLKILSSNLSIASINSQKSCVVTGPPDEIDELEQALTKERIGCRRLQVSYAYHSAMVDAILPDLIRAVAALERNAPRAAYISSVTGDWIKDDEATDPQYYALQMRKSVRFLDGVNTLIKDGHSVFVETGPGDGLCAMVRQNANYKSEFVTIPSLEPSRGLKTDAEAVWNGLGAAWQAGVNVDWNRFYANERRRKLPLPTYAFDRKRYWPEVGTPSGAASETGRAEPGSPPAYRAASSETPATPAIRAESHSVERSGMAEQYVAPRTRLEQIVSDVWSSVLGLKEIGVLDNFIDLGGDSLLATQVHSRLKQAVPAEIALQQVLIHQTIADFCEAVESGASSANGPADFAGLIKRTERDEALPMSFAQQRLWFVAQSSPETSVYNLGECVRLKGSLDTAALEASLNEIVKRHEILRTSFALVEGRPSQIVEPGWKLDLPVVDLSESPSGPTDEEVKRLALEVAVEPFELSRLPLLRARLLRLNEEEHVLLFCIHHIISDAWSFGILIREVAALYESFSTGKPSPLAELPIQYADFASWQRESFTGAGLSSQLSYWRQKLAGRVSELKLPVDRPRPQVQTFRGATEYFSIPVELTDSLKDLARKEQATMYMLLLAAFQTLLHRYTGQLEITVGSPIAGRRRLETEPLIGLFLNTLALSTDFSGNPSFRELMARVRETALGAFAHQDIPFEKLVEELHPDRKTGMTPLFQVLFNYENTPSAPVEMTGLELSREEFNNRAVGFDLILNMVDAGGSLRGALQYNTDLFDRESIARLIDHLSRLMASAAADPDARVSLLELLTDAERNQKMLDEQAREQSNRDRLKAVRRKSVVLRESVGRLDPLPSPDGA